MRAEHYFRHSLRREKGWLRALLNQHLLCVFAREIDFVLRKRRMQSHIGNQLKHFIREY